VRAQSAELDSKARQLVEGWKGFKEKQQSVLETLDRKRAEVEAKANVVRQEQESRQDGLNARAAELGSREAAFNSRVIAYGELQAENSVLKRDLQNTTVEIRKLRLDLERHAADRDDLSMRLRDLGQRFMRDTYKWLESRLSSANYSATREKVRSAIEYCRGVGFELDKHEEDGYFADLQKAQRDVLRAELEREEQARVKRAMREDILREQEIAKALEQKDREEVIVQAALEKALSEVRDQHTAEVEMLKARLAEIEEAKRALSQAQLTKEGHVYVISNVGSFGKGVFKVGMTRRLDPMDRVIELGDASVPFPFDVHMMIHCDNAPALEHALHEKLKHCRMNKVNLRKEFFRTEFEAIHRFVVGFGGNVKYKCEPTADAPALQYYESIKMPDDELEERERIFDELQEAEVKAGVIDED